MIAASEGQRWVRLPAGATARRMRPRPIARAWWADLAGAVAVSSVVVVVALWLHNRGVQDLAGGPWTAVESLGRLAGLVSADLMLVQVVLMARVPLIERRFGQDTLARWHRITGFVSLWLLLGHVVLITVGYAGTVRPAVFVEFWTLATTYPGMLLAVAAMALLVMVAVTSVRSARRRLRYESWHLLHLYAYLGIGLGLPHQLWTGTEFVSSAAARGYWWTAYAVAAGCVVVFRIALPMWRTVRHRIVVDSVVREAPGVVSVYLRGRRLERLPARAGQFLLWRFLDGPGWSRAHPYSLSAPPAPDMLRITVKDLGDGSAGVARLRPGTRAVVEGPYGRLTGEHYRGGSLTLLACGVGITPLVALLGELAYPAGQATLVYRASRESDFVLSRDLDWLATHRGLRVVYLPGLRAGSRPSWLPRSWAHLSDVDALRYLVPDIRHHDVFLCGPDPWMDAAREAAVLAGVPAARVHYERFTW